jgi:CRP/FNR family transcriptional regulator, cyclic AMP receptor protein
MAPASNPAFLPLDDAPSAFDRRAWIRLHDLGRTRQVPAGHAVVQLGAASGFVHVVVTGLLSAEAVVPSGHQIALALLVPGDLFGEPALAASPSLDMGAGPAVRTLVPSCVLSIPAGDLEEALRFDDSLRRWIHARLVDRIRRSQAMLVRVVCLPVPDRVEAVVWDLVRATGHDPPPLTQEVLASLVGATRESVNRAVASLVSQGRLVRVGRFVSVPVRASGPQPRPDRRAPGPDRREAEPFLRPPA